MKKVAVIGSGIAGLSSAYYLQNQYEVTLFEKNDYVGGHTATKVVTVEEGTFNIDTGFIVFNNWTYPNFNRLLNELNVQKIDTDMGFSVSCQQTGLEYSGESVATLFAQKRNLFSFTHWRMILDILKFNRTSKTLLEQGQLSEEKTLGEYVSELGLSQRFVEKYLIPMGAAIWSSGLQGMYEFPALYFVRFFKNHGLLNLDDRPQWAVIKGGSKTYVDRILKDAKFKLHLNSKIESVEPVDQQVMVNIDSDSFVFDEVVFACHSDEALALIKNPSPEHQQVLGNLQYQNNEVVLHTDQSLLPNNRSTWSSWNYRVKADDTEQATLSYSMNILQRLDCNTQFVVTLNDTESIDSGKILGRYEYQHPVYNRGSLKAQSERNLINGKQNLWFCGAYWYAGFHEDGLRSALDVVNALGVELEIL